MDLNSESQSVATISASADIDASVAALTLANADDPVMRFIFDTPSRMMTYTPQLLRVLVTQSFDVGCVQRTDDGLAVACWLPPGVLLDDSPIVDIVINGCAQEKRATLRDRLEELERYRPQTPHWYLAAIGVDPIGQNGGRGSVLLQSRLAECDAAHLPVFLWSSNERNIPFYERHQFEVQAILRSGTCPPMIPMIRRAH
jgi:ribosomal protein S18 acetylase RimI-like enzyme